MGIRQDVMSASALTMKIMDYCMEGLRPTQIAEKLNTTPQYVACITNAPQFQHQLAIRRESYQEKFDSKLVQKEQDALDVLKANAKEAAERMVRLLDDDSPSIRLKSAESILDRTGVARQVQNTTGPAVVVINEVDARVIKETLEMNNSLACQTVAVPVAVQTELAGEKEMEKEDAAA